MQDPIIESIKKAEDRLTNSASFLRFLGQQFVNERADVPEEEEEEELEEEKYHFMSLVLNLVNTYLYMVSVVALAKPFFCSSQTRVCSYGSTPILPLCHCLGSTIVLLSPAQNIPRM